MFSSIVRASLCTILPSALRYESPAILLHSRPSATSLIVKSNSLPATKSMARDALRLPEGSTATLALMKPDLRPGLNDIMLLFALLLDVNEGTDVCDLTL